MGRTFKQSGHTSDARVILTVLREYNGGLNRFIGINIRCSIGLQNKDKEKEAKVIFCKICAFLVLLQPMACKEIFRRFSSFPLTLKGENVKMNEFVLVCFVFLQN